MHEQQFTHHPLLVLNSFGLQQMHVKLMATMFQNMFPSINVHKVNLNAIKRCLLISYNADTQLLDFRHYSLKVVPVGASKGLKKLLQEKFPNMSRLEDISELLAKDINLSESEAEQDGTHNILELPQAYAGRGNMKAQQSAVRLTEIGPRMTLQLIKVEEGLSQGNVLYHSFNLFPKSAKRKHGPQRSPQPSKRLRTSQPGGQPASPQPGRASHKAKHRRPPGQLGISQRPGQQKDPRSPKAHRRQQGARSLKPKGPTQQGTKQGLRVPGSKFKGPGKPGLRRKQAARGKGLLQRPRAPKKGRH
ncbi:Suppressor of SWI4 1 like protein [Chelonia mydas]|uniref:Suppressor of SWI4 1 like protein n=1 Tax=Chelonia mydas TaxID=8469 RepID=M7AQA9_CHEMY|nr:Suppressor of SWI4 1 like protein [Chelonia mydas]